MATVNTITESDGNKLIDVAVGESDTVTLATKDTYVDKNIQITLNVSAMTDTQIDTVFSTVLNK